MIVQLRSRSTEGHTGMEFDFGTLAPADRYKLMVSVIVPRPIAWVVTQNEAGWSTPRPTPSSTAWAATRRW